MRTKPHRLPTVLGILLIAVSLGSAAMSHMTYVSRWTFMRAIQYAQEFGQDPYELARTGADNLAGDFHAVALVSAACTTVLAASLILLARRRGYCPCA
ncbi:MAG: hypothetical protein H6835_10915 [Planctomycetes bacterium]|nr:hypothetical protein [Planctomycetota bacterium]